VALSLCCCVCGRTDCVTAEVGPAMLGWVVDGRRQVCPKCRAFAETRSDKNRFLSEPDALLDEGDDADTGT
jgi:hypothetical protein